MAKRIQEEKEEERIVKADDTIGLACCDKFFECAKSSCIEKSGESQDLVILIGRVQENL